MRQGTSQVVERDRSDFLQTLRAEAIQFVVSGVVIGDVEVDEVDGGNFRLIERLVIVPHIAVKIRKAGSRVGA